MFTDEGGIKILLNIKYTRCPDSVSIVMGDLIFSYIPWLVRLESLRCCYK